AGGCDGRGRNALRGADRLAERAAVAAEHLRELRSRLQVVAGERGDERVATGEQLVHLRLRRGRDAVDVALQAREELARVLARDLVAAGLRLDGGRAERGLDLLHGERVRG